MGHCYAQTAQDFGDGWKRGSTDCTHAYGITNEYAKRVLVTYDEPHMPIDHSIKHLCMDIGCMSYHHEHALITQQPRSTENPSTLNA